MNEYHAIMNLLGTYGQTVDEWPRRPNDYADLFTEDAQFTDNGITVGPRSKILALMQGAADITSDQPLLAGTRHLHLNPVINIDGERGTGSVDLLVLELSPEHGWRVRGSGRYADEYARCTDGVWRFKSRILTWFKDAGPDPLNPKLGAIYADIFRQAMAD